MFGKFALMILRPNLLRTFLFASLIFCISSILEIKESQAASRSGVVVTEGAIVYRKADFDSDVIGYFPAGKRVSVSTKHFGPFLRVQFKQGVVGYISDVDVKTAKGSSTDSKASDKKDSEEKPNEEKDDDKSSEKKDKWPFNSIAIGPALGFINYREAYGQAEYEDAMLFYGVKMNVPFSLLGGFFFLDATALYHGGAPAYYNTLSQIPPTGWAGVGELDLLFTLNRLTKQSWIYAGAGLLGSFSHFIVQVRGSQQDLQELKVGASFTVGASYTLGSVLIKVEPKYFLEKTKYWGVVSSLEYAF